ncbi:DUF4926 domain-containing protein [Pseudomonas sp. R1-18]|uniref:DUF4926 domain-containing protein n=1 Tax=Pseudomonas sp. R1-18 TaxID=1632772 RepID=UPI003DA989F8
MIVISLLLLFIVYRLFFGLFRCVGLLVRKSLSKERASGAVRKPAGRRRIRLPGTAANERWTDVKLLDVVRLEVDLPLDGLFKGMTGTIVHEHSGPGFAYEVEFCDSEGRTIELLPLLRPQFSLFWSAPETEDARFFSDCITNIPAITAVSRGEEMFTYESVLEFNKPRTPSQLSYIHAAKDVGNLNDELCVYFTRIFNPIFLVIDGNIFVEVCLDQQRLEEETARGLRYDDLPYWQNLLEVTELCDDMEWDEVCELAHVISDCWNAKLKRLHPESGFASEVFIDDELDEVFVGLHRKHS